MSGYLVLRGMLCFYPTLNLKWNNEQILIAQWSLGNPERSNAECLVFWKVLEKP